MRVRCVNRNFRDLKAAGRPTRVIGEEWDMAPERFEEVNSTMYGILVEAVEGETSEPEPEPEPEPESEPEPEAEQGNPLDGLSRDELVKLAKERGIDVPKRASREAIAELIGGE